MCTKRNYPGTEKVENESKGDHCHYSLSTVERTMFHGESLSREVSIFKHSIPFSVSESRCPQSPTGERRYGQFKYDGSMGIRTAVVLYVLALVAVVVGVDVLFFRHHALERLLVNVGIVMVFAAFYLTFLKRP
jgi:hypothetical protein